MRKLLLIWILLIAGGLIARHKLWPAPDVKKWQAATAMPANYRITADALEKDGRDTVNAHYYPAAKYVGLYLKRPVARHQLLGDNDFVSQPSFDVGSDSVIFSIVLRKEEVLWFDWLNAGALIQLQQVVPATAVADKKETIRVTGKCVVVAQLISGKDSVTHVLVVKCPIAVSAQTAGFNTAADRQILLVH